jgi:hypothetical protein
MCGLLLVLNGKKYDLEFGKQEMEEERYFNSSIGNSQNIFKEHFPFFEDSILSFFSTIALTSTHAFDLNEISTYENYNKLPPSFDFICSSIKAVFCDRRSDDSKASSLGFDVKCSPFILRRYGYFVLQKAYEEGCVCFGQNHYEIVEIKKWLDEKIDDFSFHPNNINNFIREEDSKNNDSYSTLHRYPSVEKRMEWFKHLKKYAFN